MTILSPSMILLAYRAEKDSFVLENPFGVQLKLEQYNWYVTTHSDTISPVHPSVLENATEKIKYDFNA
jgi:hypothetical protein